MKSRLLFITFFCLFLFSTAQQAQAESTIDERITELNDEIEQLVSSRQFTEAISYCNAQISQEKQPAILQFITMQKMRLFAKSGNHTDSIPILYDYQKSLHLSDDSIVLFSNALSLEIVGFYNYYTHNYSNAITYFLKADSAFDKTTAYEQKITNLQILGTVYQLDDKLTDGIVTTRIALEFLEKYLPNDTNQRINLYIGLALNYFKLNKYDKAIEYYDKLTPFTLTEKQTAQVSNNLGIIYIEQKQYEKALLYLNKAKVIYKKLGANRQLSWIYNNIGSAQKNTNYEPDSILQNFNRSIKLKKSYKDSVGLTKSYLNLAGFCIVIKEFQESEKYIDTLKKFEKYFENDDFANYYNYKSIINNYNQDYEAALENYVIFHYYTDSVNKDVLNWKLTNVENEIELHKKQAHIDMLEKENTIAAVKNSKTRMMLYAISIIGIVLIFVLAMVANYYYKRQRLETNLRNREVKLASVSSLVQGQEEERLRVSRDLHDEIGSKLALIKAEIIKTGVQESNQYLGNLVTKTAEDVRNISHDLMPPTIKNFGLHEALKDLAGKWKRSADIILDVNISPIPLYISPKKALTLYRIFQELIKNSVTHGEADYCIINIIQNSKQLLIEYEDNGKGLVNMQEKHKGLGLKNIESRVSFLDGSMQIDSVESGFKISFQFNLPSNEIINS